MAANFGPVMQLGFVVPDLERAMRHWLEKVGIGPFLVLEHVKFAQVLHRGQPTDIDMSVGLAQWGEVQVELIQQFNDAPSIYTDFPGRKQGGLQHVGVMTESVADDLVRLQARGIEPVQQGHTGTGIRFAYLDTDEHPGGMIELIESGPAIVGFFQLVRDSARSWDGRDPIRRMR
ncbi:MAG TPA: VOC family protein [Steroidobacteraceae bacterium]